MAAKQSSRPRAAESASENEQERLKSVLKDLRGVERLQQMQWRLLREAIQEVEQLRRT